MITNHNLCEVEIKALQVEMELLRAQVEDCKLAGEVAVKLAEENIAEVERQAALLKMAKDALQKVVTPNVVEGTTVGQVILVHNQIAMNALMEIESFEKGTE